MHILLLTHYFPPESNAPANRSFEHARAWVALGHDVTVVTAAPSHPRGQVYPGYRNRFDRTIIEGIEVIRLKTFIAPNKGRFARIAGFLSYFFSVAVQQYRLPRADIVLSTSPQFFCGLSGWLLKRRRRPWVLEIRDIWPESIVAVGAMKRNPAIRLLEWIEAAAYRHADLIVVTTDAHKRHVEGRGARVPALVIRNGITPDRLRPDRTAAEMFRTTHALEKKFVVSYVGTHGMAHGLDTVIDAAILCRATPKVHFLLVGDGADHDRLSARSQQLGLENLTMIGQQPREAIPAIWAASDAAMVLLRRQATFLSVLPSKMFEAMAMAKPIILGVEGEANDVLGIARAGIAITPEDASALASAAIHMAHRPDEANAMGERGRKYVLSQLDRTVLAATMAARMQALLS